MSTTVTDHQTPGKPGIPCPANGKPEGQHRPPPAAPPSPWNAHLRSLVGRWVTVASYGRDGLVEYKGRLIAIDLNHLNCAIESGGTILTFKNVHHIESPAAGPKAGA